MAKGFKLQSKQRKVAQNPVDFIGAVPLLSNRMAYGIWIRRRSPRPSEVWIVYRDAQGGRRREKIGLDTTPVRHLAKEVLAKRRYEISSGKFFPARAGEIRTFQELAEKYWELWGQHRDDSWFYRLEELKREFGRRKMSELSTAAIQGYYNRKAAETTPSSANRNLALLKAVINRAADWGDFHGDSPANKVKRQRDNPSRTRFLAIQEIEKFLGKCDPRLYPMAVCAIMTGMRQAEVFKLEWKDVDLEHGNIHVHETKSGRSREIPITSKLRTVLEGLGPKRDGLVFGLCHMTFRRLFDDARDKAGLPPFRWHDLRHTFASHYTMKNADLPALQKLLGHATPSMVLRYAHMSKGHLQSEMAVFDSAMPQVCATLPESVSDGIGHQGSHQAPTGVLGESQKSVVEYTLPGS